MKTYEKIELSNGSILKKIYSGGKLNWIFISGGPGLGEEYLTNFLSRKNYLKNSIYILKYPKFNPNYSDEKILENLEEDINQALSILNNAILVGHSFGGMLIQSIKLKQKYKKIVLLSSSPNLDCFKIADENYNNFTENEKKEIVDNDKLYAHNKNNLNFKKLFKSWAPFYVDFKNRDVYESMIDKCSFDYEFYEWGNRFFNNFFSTHATIAINTITINSINDKICPAVLFKSHSTQLSEIHELDNSSHFPWIENTQSTISLLQKIEEEVDSILV